MVTIVTEAGVRTRVHYPSGTIFINSYFDEDTRFLAILHEYGHMVTNDPAVTMMQSEVLAWDWVESHMGDFDKGKYESIRNSRLVYRMELLLDGADYTLTDGGF